MRSRESFAFPAVVVNHRPRDSHVQRETASGDTDTPCELQDSLFTDSLSTWAFLVCFSSNKHSPSAQIGSPIAYQPVAMQQINVSTRMSGTAPAPFMPLRTLRVASVRPVRPCCSTAAAIDRPAAKLIDGKKIAGDIRKEVALEVS